MRESELKKLIIEEFLSCVADPRMERGRKHSLENIVVISLLAVISGADSFVAIEDFAEAKQPWLATFLDLRDGIPSHDTIGRVFGLLDPRSLAEAFRRWTLAMSTLSKEKLIAIDGKTLRRSFRHAGDNAFVHMVSAWSAANHVVLGQVKTDDKSNEITAIPELLDFVDVKGALVSIDAAGTQTAIAEKIVDKAATTCSRSRATSPRCTLRSSSTSLVPRTASGSLASTRPKSTHTGATNCVALGSATTSTPSPLPSAGPSCRC